MNKYSKDVKTIRNRVVEVGFYWWQSDPHQSYRLRMSATQYAAAQKHVRSRKLIAIGFEQFMDLITPIFASDAAEISAGTLRSTFDYLFDQNSNGTVEYQELESLAILMYGFNTPRLAAFRDNVRQLFNNRANHLNYKDFSELAKCGHLRELFMNVINTEQHLYHSAFMTAVILGRLSVLTVDLIRRFGRQNYRVVGQENENERHVTRTIVDGLPQGRIRFLSDRLRFSSDVDQFIERIFDHSRQVNILVVNHQGRQHYRAAIEEFPVEKWKEAIDESLHTTFTVIKSLWPQMKRQHFGRIIHITDELSSTPGEYQSARTTSHHALLGLNQALAIEGAPYGITSNVICPGRIRAGFLEHHADIQTITDLALFLCTDQARTITGQTILWNDEPVRSF